MSPGVHLFFLDVRRTASASDASFSWRDAGQVTHARLQNDCNVCYTFAAVAALEANWAVRRQNVMIDASEQHVLNCIPGSCKKGGRLFDAMTHLVDHGTCSEKEDSYSNGKHLCSSKPIGFKADRCGFVTEGNDFRPTSIQLKDALLAHGPLAAFIYAKGLDSDNHYDTDAVIADNPKEDSKKYNHFVLIVGWDDNKTYPGGKGAWEIKNSWGKDWGRNGFAFVAYGVRSIGDNAMWIEVPPST